MGFLQPVSRCRRRAAGRIELATRRDELPINDLAHLIPSIELRNVSFRCGEGEPWILKDTNLLLTAWESVAINGLSGCGKSTLLKVLLGLLTTLRASCADSQVCLRHPIQ